MQKKVLIKTFGCQMNEDDSDKMAGLLGASAGLVRTASLADGANAQALISQMVSVRINESLDYSLRGEANL